jgi:antitoxin component YwqK of YwqJK toxin-antitoxin module
MNGPAHLYDSNGLIKQEGNYLNDAEDGEWKEYTNGKLVKTILYKNGTVIKETLAN